MADKELKIIISAYAGPAEKEIRRVVDVIKATFGSVKGFEMLKGEAEGAKDLAKEAKNAEENMKGVKAAQDSLASGGVQSTVIAGLTEQIIALTAAITSLQEHLMALKAVASTPPAGGAVSPRPATHVAPKVAAAPKEKGQSSEDVGKIIPIVDSAKKAQKTIKETKETLLKEYSGILDSAVPYAAELEKATKLSRDEARVAFYKERKKQIARAKEESELMWRTSAMGDLLYANTIGREPGKLKPSERFAQGTLPMMSAKAAQAGAINDLIYSLNITKPKRLGELPEIASATVKEIETMLLNAPDIRRLSTGIAGLTQLPEKIERAERISAGEAKVGAMRGRGRDLLREIETILLNAPSMQITSAVPGLRGLTDKKEIMTDLQGRVARNEISRKELQVIKDSLTAREQDLKVVTDLQDRLSKRNISWKELKVMRDTLSVREENLKRIEEIGEFDKKKAGAMLTAMEEGKIGKPSIQRDLIEQRVAPAVTLMEDWMKTTNKQASTLQLAKEREIAIQRLQEQGFTKLKYYEDLIGLDPKKFKVEGSGGKILAGKAEALSNADIDLLIKDKKQLAKLKEMGWTPTTTKLGYPSFTSPSGHVEAYGVPEKEARRAFAKPITRDIQLLMQSIDFEEAVKKAAPEIQKMFPADMIADITKVGYPLQTIEELQKMRTTAGKLVSDRQAEYAQEQKAARIQEGKEQLAFRESLVKEIQSIAASPAFGRAKMPASAAQEEGLWRMMVGTPEKITARMKLEDLSKMQKMGYEAVGYTGEDIRAREKKLTLIAKEAQLLKEISLLNERTGKAWAANLRAENVTVEDLAAQKQRMMERVSQLVKDIGGLDERAGKVWAGNLKAENVKEADLIAAKQRLLTKRTDEQLKTVSTKPVAPYGDISPAKDLREQVTEQRQLLKQITAMDAEVGKATRATWKAQGMSTEQLEQIKSEVTLYKEKASILEKIKKVSTEEGYATISRRTQTGQYTKEDLEQILVKEKDLAKTRKASATEYESSVKTYSKLTGMSREEVESLKLSSTQIQDLTARFKQAQVIKRQEEAESKRVAREDIAEQKRTMQEVITLGEKTKLFSAEDIKNSNLTKEELKNVHTQLLGNVEAQDRYNKAVNEHVRLVNKGSADKKITTPEDVRALNLSVESLERLNQGIVQNRQQMASQLKLGKLMDTDAYRAEMTKAIELGQKLEIFTPQDITESKLLLSKLKLINAELTEMEKAGGRRIQQKYGISDIDVQTKGLTPERLKQFDDAFMKMKASAESTSIGIEKAQKAIVQWNSGQTAKGGRTPVGFTQEDFLIVKDVASKSKEADDMVKKVGYNLDATQGKIATFINSTKEMAKFQLQFYAGMGAIFGTLATLRSLIGAAIEFDQTLRNIQAASGMTAKETNALGDSLLVIAKNVPVAIENLQQLALQLTYAGVANENLAAATEVSAKVALISGEEMKEVAFAVATVVQAWGLSGNEIEKVGSTIAIAFNKSRMQVQDLGTALNYIAGMMSNLKMPIEEVMAVLATLSNLGVRASTLATGWRQFMSDMLGPSHKLSQYFKAMGADMSKLDPSMIKGPHKMVQILKELQAIGMDTSKAFALLQTRSASFYMFLSTAGPQKLIDMENAMGDVNALNDAVAKVKAGLKMESVQMWNDIKAAVVDVIRTIMPLLQLLVHTLTLVAEGIAGIGDAIATPAGKAVILTGVVWGLVAAFKALRVATQTQLGMTGVQAALNVATAMTAEGTIATGASAVASGGFIATIGKYIAKIIEATKAGGGFIAIMGRIINLFGFWGKVIGGILIAIGVGNIFEKIFGSEKSVIKSTEGMNIAQEKLAKMGLSLDDLGDKAQENMNKTAESIKAIVKDVQGYQVNLFQDKQMKTPIPELTAFETALEPVWGINEKAEKLEEKLRKVREELAKLPKQTDAYTFLDAIGMLFNRIKNMAAGVANVLGGAVASAFRGFIKLIKEAIDEAKKAPAWTIQGALGRLGGLIATGVEVVQEGYQIGMKTDRDDRRKALETEKKNLTDDITSLKKKASDELQKVDATGLLKNLMLAATRKMTVPEQEKAFLEQVTQVIIKNAGRSKAAMRQSFMDLGEIREAYEQVLHPKEKHDKAIDQYISNLNKQVSLDKAQMSEKIEQYKTEKDLRDENIKQEFDATKAALDRRQQLNEEYYGLSIKSAIDYYREKEALIDSNAKNEIDQAKALMDSKLVLENNTVGEIQTAQSSLRSKMITTVAKYNITTDKDDKEKLKNEILTIAKDLSQLSKEEETHFRAATKALEVYDLQEQKIKEQVEIQKQQIKIKRQIDEATFDTKLESEKLASQKEYTQLIIQQATLQGDWVKSEQATIEMKKLETQLAMNTLKIKQAELIVYEKEAIALRDKALAEGDTAAGNRYQTIIDNLKERNTLTEKQKTLIKEISEMEIQDIVDPISAGFRKLESEWKNYKKNVTDLMVGMYEDISKAGSDIFFDAVKGQLKSIGDYFKSLTDRILRYFTDLLARMAAEALVKPILIQIATVFGGATGMLTGTPNPVSAMTGGGGGLTGFGGGSTVGGTSSASNPFGTSLSSSWLGRGLDKVFGTPSTGGGKLYSGGYTMLEDGTVIKNAGPSQSEVLAGYGVGSTPNLSEWPMQEALGTSGSIGEVNIFNQAPTEFTGFGNQALNYTPAEMGEAIGSVQASKPGTSPLGYAGSALMMAGGAYGVFNAYKNRDAFGGVMSGAMMGAPLGPVGMAVGAVAGLLAGLFGEKKRPPSMNVQYNPGQRPDIMATEQGEKGGFQNASIQGAAGVWSVNEQQGIPHGIIEPLAKMFSNAADHLKTSLSDIGLDTSGFEKKWFKHFHDLGGKTQQEIEQIMKDTFGEYATFVTGIDFAKLKSGSEDIVATIDRIIGAITSIGKMQKLDVSQMFKDIDLIPNTAKEKIKTDFEDLTKAIDKLPGLSGEEWGNQLTTIGQLSAQAYDDLKAYLTYLKQSMQELKDDARTMHDTLALDKMTEMQKTTFYMKEFYATIDLIGKEEDPEKLAKLWQRYKTDFNNLYGSLKAFIDKVKALGQTFADTLEQMKMNNMTPEQQVSYINQNIGRIDAAGQAAMAAYDQAKAGIYDTSRFKDANEAILYWAGEIASLGEELNTWVQKGMGLGDVDWEKTLGNTGGLLDRWKGWMDELGGDGNTAIGMLDKSITDVSDLITDKLGKEVTDLTTQVHTIQTELDKIDFNPMYTASKAAGDFATAIGGAIGQINAAVGNINTQVDAINAGGDTSGTLPGLNAGTNWQYKIGSAGTGSGGSTSGATGGTQTGFAGTTQQAGTTSGTTPTGFLANAAIATGQMGTPATSTVNNITVINNAPITPKTATTVEDYWAAWAGLSSGFTFQAEGGFYDKPTYIPNMIVGEAGPEYILPEKKLKELIKETITSDKEIKSTTDNFKSEKLQTEKTVTPFAEGGFFSKPTIISNALVGEAGPEYIIPESKMKGLIKEISREKATTEKSDKMSSKEKTNIAKVIDKAVTDKMAYKTSNVVSEKDSKLSSSVISNISKDHKAEVLSDKKSEVSKLLSYVSDKKSSMTSDVTDKVTAFATGGFFNKPTYISNALVGEAGPEYIIPESNLKELISKTTKESSEAIASTAKTEDISKISDMVSDKTMKVIQKEISKTTADKTTALVSHTNKDKATFISDKDKENISNSISDSKTQVTSNTTTAFAKGGYFEKATFVPNVLIGEAGPEYNIREDHLISTIKKANEDKSSVDNSQVINNSSQWLKSSILSTAIDGKYDSSQHTTAIDNGKVNATVGGKENDLVVTANNIKEEWLKSFNSSTAIDGKRNTTLNMGGGEYNPVATTYNNSILKGGEINNFYGGVTTQHASNEFLNWGTQPSSPLSSAPVTPQATGGFFNKPTLIPNMLIGEAGAEYNIKEEHLIRLIQEAVATQKPLEVLMKTSQVSEEKSWISSVQESITTTAKETSMVREMLEKIDLDLIKQDSSATPPVMQKIEIDTPTTNLAEYSSTRNTQNQRSEGDKYVTGTQLVNALQQIVNEQTPGSSPVVIYVSEELGSRLKFQTETSDMTMVRVERMFRDPRTR